MNATLVTRSDFEAAARERYRHDTLRLLTPKWAYGLVIALFLGLQGLILGAVKAPEIAISIAIAVATVFFFVATRFSRHDREIRLRASMTPIYDMLALRGQVDVLSSAVSLLQEVVDQKRGKPALRQASDALFSALKPLLERGPTTVENARVAGYPPYPDIETVAMPGDDQDFVTMHLLRIEASFLRLRDATTANGALAETVSQIAGEFVPPLRAIQAQLD